MEEFFFISMEHKKANSTRELNLIKTMYYLLLGWLKACTSVVLIFITLIHLRIPSFNTTKIPSFHLLCFCV